MVLFEQAVEQRLVQCASHRAELERPDLGQTAVQRLRVHFHHGWSFALHQWVRHVLPNRRQLDQALAVQLQHQPSTDHGSQGSVRLPPVPNLTEQRGKGSPTGLRMFGNELPNQSDIGIGDHALPVAPYGLHVAQPNRSLSGTQVLPADFSFCSFGFLSFLPARYGQADTAARNPGAAPAKFADDSKLIRAGLAVCLRLSCVGARVRLDFHEVPAGLVSERSRMTADDCYSWRKT